MSCRMWPFWLVSISLHVVVSPLNFLDLFAFGKDTLLCYVVHLSKRAAVQPMDPSCAPAGRAGMPTQGER